MKLIEYDPSKSFDQILDSLDLSVPSTSVIHIFPDIPVIRQIERRYSSAGIWSDNLYTFAKLASLSNIRTARLSNHISKPGRLMVMEEVLDELQQQLGTLGPYSGVHGFSDSLLGLLAELKQMGMAPDDLEKLSFDTNSSSLALKLGDISRLFKLYQEKLSSFNMADDIDLLHNLVNHIRGGELDNFLKGTQTVAVFGFYDFTQSQIEVLNAIDEKIENVVVMIPIFKDLEKLRSRVKSKFSSKTSYNELPGIINEDEQHPDTCIRTYPLINDELDAVFKEIKRLVLEEEYKFDDIAVIFRSIGNNTTRLINTADKYGIPISIDDSLSLRNSIYGSFVNDLLSLAVSNYKRNDLIRLLKNPVTGAYLDNDGIDDFIRKIELLSSDKYKVYQGYNNWKGFFGEPAVNEGIRKDILARATGLLDTIYSRLNRKSMSEMVSGICSVLDMIDIKGITDDLLSEGKIARSCWESFNSFIRELRFISGKFDRKFDSPGEFISLINELVSEKTYGYSTESDSGVIQVLQGLQVRGVKYSVVFLVNADEDSFPSPHIKDPVLKVQERKEINQVIGKEIFPEDYIHYEKEEHLFNLITKSAGDKLFVSCSRFDSDYNEKNRSYFIDTIQDAEVKEHGFTDTHSETGIFSAADLMAVYFADCFHGKKVDEVKKYIVHKTGFDLISRIEAGINAENSRSRLSGEYSPWEGLANQALTEPRLYFRPTELEEYGICPFRYFSDYILGLKEDRKVEDTIEPMDLGKLYHQVLRDLFCCKLNDFLKREKINELTSEIALDRYYELMNEERYDSFFSHLSDPVKDLEKKKVLGYILPSFIKDEIDRITGEYDFVPFMFEREVSIEEDNYGISGKIDRVDVDTDDNVIVYDYKSGSVGNRKYYDFRNLQLPIYLMSLKQTGFKPYGGYYLSVKKGDRTGKEGAGNLELEDAVKRVNSYIEYIRKGVFPPVIADKEINFTDFEKLLEYSFGISGTCRYCGYSDLCRVKSGVTRKGETREK